MTKKNVLRYTDLSLVICLLLVWARHDEQNTGILLRTSSPYPFKKRSVYEKRGKLSTRGSKVWGTHAGGPFGVYSVVQSKSPSSAVIISGSLAEEGTPFRGQDFNL